MLAQVLEEARTVYVVERCLTSFHRVKQIARRTPRRFTAHEQNLEPKLILVSLQRRRHRRQLEPVTVDLNEDALTREESKNSAEGWGVRPGRPREVGHGPWTVGEQVGDAKLGRDVDCLADPVAAEQTHQLFLGRAGPSTHQDASHQ